VNRRDLGLLRRRKTVCYRSHRLTRPRSGRLPASGGKGLERVMNMRPSDQARKQKTRGSVSGSVIAHLGIPPPPVLRFSSVKAPMTIARLKSTAAARDDHAELPRDDAWIFRLHLRELSAHRLWLDGKPVPVPRCPPGSISLYDLQRVLAVSIVDPLDVVRIFVPRAALDELSDEFGAARVKRIGVVHGAISEDTVVHALISCMLPAIDTPKAVFGLFVDHLALSLLAHIGRKYGAMEAAPRVVRGGLSHWQEHRAKEMLEAHIQSDIPLSTVAAACGLSASHFARAFKQSTGQPPHRWLLHRRVARAKDLLSGSSTPLAEAALACGFADQSHFGRVFERVVGVTPGAWRRSRA
jgi:AraC family transcriptional regulator